MNLLKIKKIKQELEATLINIKRQMEKEGIEKTKIKNKINSVKRKVLKKLLIDEEEYDSIESMVGKDEKETSDENDLKVVEFLEELSIENQIESILKRLEQLLARMDEVESKKISWNDIEERPDVNQLEDARTKSEFLIRKDIKDLSEVIDDKIQKINNSIDDYRDSSISLIEEKANKPILHSELLEIGPDDHHAEKHILESHSTSDMMTDLKKLLSGGYMEQFNDYLERYLPSHLPHVIDIAGITKNDADSYYLKYTGGLDFPDISTASGKYLTTDGSTLSWATVSGTGTVTSVSVVTANGISGSVATETTTPAITLTLGAITPTTVNGLTLTAATTGFTLAGGTTSKTLTVSNTLTLAGTDTSTLNIGTGGTLGTAAFTAATAYAAALSGTANEIAYFNTTTTIASLAVATYPSLTELSYVKGLSSAVQTQFTGKAATGQTFYIGTTQVAINRASAALTLAGITLTTPDIGTPSAGTLTNCTGLPVASILPGTLATGLYLLAENASIGLDPAGSVDGKYTGITVTGVAGATIAFGDLITLDKDDSRWELVDISAAAAATGDARGILGMAVSAGNDGDAITILLEGIIRADANFPTLTIGANVYASTTGDIVVTQPSTTDYVIRIIGGALTANEIFFRPDFAWITHT